MSFFVICRRGQRHPATSAYDHFLVHDITFTHFEKLLEIYVGSAQLELPCMDLDLEVSHCSFLHYGNIRSSAPSCSTTFASLAHP